MKIQMGVFLKKIKGPSFELLWNKKRNEKSFFSWYDWGLEEEGSNEQY